MKLLQIFQQLNDFFSPDSPNVNLLINVQSKYDRLIKNNIKGTILHENYEVGMQKVTENLMLIVDQITEYDFE